MNKPKPGKGNRAVLAEGKVIPIYKCIQVQTERFYVGDNCAPCPSPVESTGSKFWVKEVRTCGLFPHFKGTGQSRNQLRQVVP